MSEQAEPTGVVAIISNSKKTGKTAEFERDFGVNLEAAVALFGADAVHAGFVNDADTTCKNIARQHMDKGKTVDEAIAAAMAWVPGVKRSRAAGPKKDTLAKYAERIKSGAISLDDLLAELKTKLEAQVEA